MLRFREPFLKRQSSELRLGISSGNMAARTEAETINRILDPNGSGSG